MTSFGQNFGEQNVPTIFRHPQVVTLYVTPIPAGPDNVIPAICWAGIQLTGKDYKPKPSFRINTHTALPGRRNNAILWIPACARMTSSGCTCPNVEPPFFRQRPIRKRHPRVLLSGIQLTGKDYNPETSFRINTRVLSYPIEETTPSPGSPPSWG